MEKWAITELVAAGFLNGLDIVIFESHKQAVPRACGVNLVEWLPRAETESDFTDVSMENQGFKQLE